LRLSIKATPEEPLVNPVFVIKGADKNKPFTLLINNSNASDYRAGYERDNMVIWIPFTSTEATSVELVY
jgi:hypothetical protein